MEKKGSLNSYSLIFEPKYSSGQYAIRFDNVGNPIITRINKYSDTIYNGKSKIKKNSLSDIDRITASKPSLEAFFKEYVPEVLFRYHPSDLHKMFIGRMYNGYMINFKYVINNPKLLSKLDLVSGSKIYDYEGINSMIELIRSSKNNGFMRFVISEKKEKKTNISNDTITLALQVRSADDCIESASDRIALKRNLEEKLTSYKEYREMFLLQSHYQDKLEADKKRLENLKTEAVKTVLKPQENITGEQLTMFGFEPQKVKRFEQK